MLLTFSFNDFSCISHYIFIYGETHVEQSTLMVVYTPFIDHFLQTPKHMICFNMYSQR